MIGEYRYRWLLRVAFALSICKPALGLPLWKCLDPPTNMWIDPLKYKNGMLQSPNFQNSPDQLSNCVWIFNNTGLPQSSNWYLHIYYSKLHFSVTEVNGSLASLESHNSFPNWTARPSHHQLIINASQSMYVILKANNDFFKANTGLNLTFEMSTSGEKRSGICVAKDSSNKNNNNNNNTAEEDCFVQEDETRQKISGLFCHCESQSENSLLPNQLLRCTGKTDPCKNGGICRMTKNDQIRRCQCPAGFSGSTCEVEKVDTKCEKKYFYIEVEASSLNKIYSLLKDQLVPRVKRNYQTPPSIHKTFVSLPNGTTVGWVYFFGMMGYPSNFSLLHSLQIVNSPKLSRFCANKKLDSNEKGGQIEQGQELALTCLVQGATNPIFKWYKGHEKILATNITLPNRHMEQTTRAVDLAKGTFAGSLFIRPVLKLDQGMFECKVFEMGNSSLIPSGSYTTWPTVSSFLYVEVLTRPQITVAPLVATRLIESKDIKGQTKLYCFTAESKSAKRIGFEWKYHNGSLVRHEATEVMLKPHGLTLNLLKLGQIQEDSAFTCTAYDKRRGHRKGPQLVTNLKTEVLVAHKLEDTCKGGPIGGFDWPMTKKGTKAFHRCPRNAVGYMWLYCDPATLHWQTVVPDKSGCIRHKFLAWQKKVNQTMGGYLQNLPPGEQLVNLFTELPDLCQHNGPPSVSELKLAFDSLSSIIVDYIGHFKIVDLDYEIVAESFYINALSTLVKWDKNLHQQLALDVYKLVLESARVFGQKINQNSQIVWKNNGNFCNDHLILVKRLMLISNTAVAWLHEKATWQKSPRQTRIMENRIVPDQTMSKGQNEVKCKGLTTKVTVSVSPASIHTKHLQEVGSVAIIHFKHLETLLEDNQSLKKYQSKSPLITILYDGPSNVVIDISIRFFDFGPNDDDGLTCGSIEFKDSGGVKWTRKDAFCWKEWHPDGLTCHCNKPGTFVLVSSPPDFDTVAQPVVQQHRHYAVILCCGCSLTMCVLSMAALLRHFLRRKGSMMVLLHAQVCGLLASIMMAIILAVAEFVPEHANKMIGTGLQFMMLASICCQLNVPSVLFVAAKWKFVATEFKGLVFVLSFLLPGIYVATSMNMIEWERHSFNIKLGEIEWKNWFVRSNSHHFVAYVTMNVILIGSYIPICYLAAQKIQNSDMKSLKRLVLIKESILIMLGIVALNVSIIYYVNTPDSGSTEFALSFPCASMGIIVFWCYVIRGDGVQVVEDNNMKVNDDGIKNIVVKDKKRRPPLESHMRPMRLNQPNEEGRYAKAPSARNVTSRQPPLVLDLSEDPGLQSKVDHIDGPMILHTDQQPIPLTQLLQAHQLVSEGACLKTFAAEVHSTTSERESKTGLPSSPSYSATDEDEYVMMSSLMSTNNRSVPNFQNCNPGGRSLQNLNKPLKLPQMVGFGDKPLLSGATMRLPDVPTGRSIGAYEPVYAMMGKSNNIYSDCLPK